VTYDGEFWKINNYSLGLKPVQKPHPPIWIGASGPRMLKITATHGNGWFGPQLIPKRYAELLERLQTKAKKIGRKTEEITPAHLSFTSISKDHEVALKWLEPHVRWFLVWASQPPSNLPQTLGYRETWKTEQEVPVEAIERCFILGTPEECISKIESFIESGARYFVLDIHAPNQEKYLESLRLYAQEVASHFT